MKTTAFALIVMLFIGILPISAQDDFTCDVDVRAVLDTLQGVEVAVDNENEALARNLLQQAQREINDLLSDCVGLTNQVILEGEDNRIQLSYPSDWFASNESASFVFMVNDSSLLDDNLFNSADAPQLESGQVLLALGLIGADELPDETAGLTDLVAIVDVLIDVIGAEEDELFNEIGNAQALDLSNDYNGAIGSLFGSDINASLGVVDLGNKRYLQIILVTPSSELQQWQDTLLMILNSMVRINNDG